MKKVNLSEILNFANLKRVAALALALMILVCAVGCKKDKEDGSSSASSASSQQENSSNASSEASSSEEATSSENSTVTSNTSTSGGNNTAKIDPLDGDINVEYEYKAGSSRSDAEEITPAVDPAPYFAGYVGYAQEERDALLNEILNTKNTLEYYDVKGTIYYVSTSGNDANDGLTPETAIQSLAAVDSLNAKDGDAVLFERGCVWRMLERFAVTEGVTYGSYGEGRKPMIYGSPRNYAQEVWKPSKKKNVWQINYMYAYPAGGFFNEGKEVGYQKLTLAELKKNTDYFCDEESATLYLYCDKGNPSNVWESIEFSQEGMCFYMGTGVDRVTIDNIAIRYTGSGGIGSHYDNEQLIVTNCEIGYTGGAWLGTVRAGNGIGTWCGGLNMKWNHNWIYQTFDSGVSPQGNVNNHNYDNISISNNLFEYNNCDIESWESGYRRSDVTAPMATYSNNHYDNNICRFTSLGWGTRVDDGGIRGIDGVHYGHFGPDQIKSMTFNNNIIDCPGRMIYKMSIDNKGCYDNWERKGNVYYIKQSMRTMEQLTYQFHWIDDETRVAGHSANTKEETLAAFKEFEPNATVYWYP